METVGDTVPMATVAAPVPAEERVGSMDLVRGVAVLGILLMNILGFALPFAASFRPHRSRRHFWRESMDLGDQYRPLRRQDARDLLHAFRRRDARADVAARAARRGGRVGRHLLPAPALAGGVWPRACLLRLVGRHPVLLRRARLVSVSAAPACRSDTGRRRSVPAAHRRGATSWPPSMSEAFVTRRSRPMRRPPREPRSVKNRRPRKRLGKSA